MINQAIKEFIARQTRDCDILQPRIPADIGEAAVAFANEMKKQGIILDENWFNAEPASLVLDLPDGWESRTREIYRGKALHLDTLGRRELLMSKLFALCDRGTDLQDCIALQPSAEELESVISWLTERDLHPDWPEHVATTLDHLLVETQREL